MIHYREAKHGSKSYAIEIQSPSYIGTHWRVDVTGRGYQTERISTSAREAKDVISSLLEMKTVIDDVLTMMVESQL